MATVPRARTTSSSLKSIAGAESVGPGRRREVTGARQQLETVLLGVRRPDLRQRDPQVRDHQLCGQLEHGAERHRFRERDADVACERGQAISLARRGFVGPALADVAEESGELRLHGGGQSRHGELHREAAAVGVPRRHLDAKPGRDRGRDRAGIAGGAR